VTVSVHGSRLAGRLLLNDENGDSVDRLSRRHFLAGSAGLTALAATGALSGCSRTTSVSSNPQVLTLWYWNLSISEHLLDIARKQIPGTSRRLSTDKIGGNFDVKLRTSFAGEAYIPDVTGLNSNVASYFPIEDQFVDLNELGAARFKPDFLDWKWQLGVTPKDRVCFWPMDTGPTALWFRRDVFAKAALPSEPDALSQTVRTWPAWLETGAKLKRNADARIVANAQTVYNAVLNASKDRYFSQAGTPLYENDGSNVRKAWDIAVKAAQAGITSRAQTDGEKNSSYVTGRTASHLEAVWWAGVLKTVAPRTSGKWAVASQPERPGNSGGSFLCIPKTSKDPKAAFDFISWLTTPENQVRTYQDAHLFPSTPKSFDATGLSVPDKFFGGQDIFRAFAEAAKQVPITFISPYESRVGDGIATELVNVETQNKDPQRAWDDAMAQATRQLKKKGLES
jgi:cellobiose transport system substrate-binding protein